MLLTLQGQSLGYLGDHQFWASEAEFNHYLEVIRREQNILWQLCNSVVRLSTAVPRDSKAVRLFNKILRVAVGSRYEAVATLQVALEGTSLPSRLFALEQLGAEIRLRFLESPHVVLTAQEVTGTKQRAIARQQFLYVLCSHMAGFLLTEYIFAGRRGDELAGIDDGMFARAQYLARKDIRWRDNGLWTSQHTHGWMIRHLALYVKMTAADNQPADNDSLQSLIVERRKAIELHTTVVQNINQKEVPETPGQPGPLEQVRYCLQKIIADLTGLIGTGDDSGRVEDSHAVLQVHQTAEEPEPLVQDPAVDHQADNGVPAPLQPASNPVGVSIPVTESQEAVRDHEQGERPVLQELQDGNHEHDTQDDHSSEVLVRTFPSAYLVNGVGPHGLSGRQSREILHSTFSRQQLEAIRRGQATAYGATPDPFTGVRDEDIREELREFAYSLFSVVDDIQSKDPCVRDVPWSEAVDRSVFQPDELASASVAIQDPEKLEVDEEFLRNPEKESFEDAFGE